MLRIAFALFLLVSSTALAQENTPHRRGDIVDTLVDALAAFLGEHKPQMRATVEMSDANVGSDTVTYREQDPLRVVEITSRGFIEIGGTIARERGVRPGRYTVIRHVIFVEESPQRPKQTFIKEEFPDATPEAERRLKLSEEGLAHFIDRKVKDLITYLEQNKRI